MKLFLLLLIGGMYIAPVYALDALVLPQIEELKQLYSQADQIAADAAQ